MLVSVQNEIDYLVQLDHPNIIKILAVEEDEKYICLVLEVMKGGDVSNCFLSKPQFLVMLTHDRWQRIDRVTSKKCDAVDFWCYRVQSQVRHHPSRHQAGQHPLCQWEQPKLAGQALWLRPRKETPAWWVYKHWLWNSGLHGSRSTQGSALRKSLRHLECRSRPLHPAVIVAPLFQLRQVWVVQDCRARSILNESPYLVEN
jgi:hypothetical protein